MSGNLDDIIERYQGEITLNRSIDVIPAKPVCGVGAVSFKQAAKKAAEKQSVIVAANEWRLDGNARYERKKLTDRDIQADERHAKMEVEKYDISRPIIKRWMKAQGR